MKKVAADPVASLKGLADPTRLRIMGLLALADAELCVCQIEAALGESQYKVSRHLRILKQCGWVDERRDGRWVHYRMARREENFLRSLQGALGCLDADFLHLRVKLEGLSKLKKSPPKRSHPHA